MRFLVTREKLSENWRKLLIGLMLFVSLFTVLDVVLHYHLIGLTPEVATVTLFGDEALFEEPILLGALLLHVHIDWFISMFVLLILAGVYIRLFEAKKNTAISVHLLFLGGVLSPLVLLASYFSSQLWIVYVWIGLFLFTHLLMLIMSLKIIWKLK